MPRGCGLTRSAKGGSGSGGERKARVPISASGVIAGGNKSAVDGVERSGASRNSINAEDRPTAEVRIDDTRTSLSARGVVFPESSRTCLRSDPVSLRDLPFFFRFLSHAALVELRFFGAKAGEKGTGKEIPDGKHGGPFFLISGAPREKAMRSIDVCD